MKNQIAASFRSLHHDTIPLLLPNAWDAASAGVIARTGARAIATTSAGVAWALGYRDGRSLPADEALAAAARIVRVLDMPLSVDIENGYSDDPEAVAGFVRRLVDLGVAGINIEDGADDPGLLTAKIEAIRAALALDESDLFVNARCDVFLAGLASPARRVEETIARASRYAAAGADGVFVPGSHASSDILAIVQAVPVPLNVMAWSGLASVSDLAALGVKRLSAGSAIAQLVWGVTERAAKGFLVNGESEPPLRVAAKSFAEIQQLFPEA